MQALLRICELAAANLDIVFNLRKTVCMIFTYIKRNYTNKCFPKLILNSMPLEFVQEFTYLGHLILNNLSDDKDIDRVIRGLFSGQIACVKDSLYAHNLLNFCYLSRTAVTSMALHYGEIIHVHRRRNSFPVTLNVLRCFLIFVVWIVLLRCFSSLILSVLITCCLMKYLVLD